MTTTTNTPAPAPAAEPHTAILARSAAQRATGRVEELGRRLAELQEQRRECTRTQLRGGVPGARAAGVIAGIDAEMARLQYDQEAARLQAEQAQHQYEAAMSGPDPALTARLAELRREEQTAWAEVEAALEALRAPISRYVHLTKETKDLAQRLRLVTPSSIVPGVATVIALLQRFEEDVPLRLRWGA